MCFLVINFWDRKNALVFLTIFFYGKDVNQAGSLR